MLTKLWSDHKEAMRELAKGGAITDATKETVLKVANKIAKSYEVK